MHILVSNDDGYFSTGIDVLAKTLAKLGKVTVVAPEQNRSGASNSLTLDRPLFLRQADNGYFYVNGTPTDCVHLALTGLLDSLPDVVVSGINVGANMGDDTIYSGTVAAATEGFLFGLPAFAVSCVGDKIKHYESAAQVVAELIPNCLANTAKKPFLLNVNVPDLPYEALGSRQITRLGKRHRAEPVVKIITPRGDCAYWIGPAGDAQDAGPGTDFFAVNQQNVSITPLQIDLTNFTALTTIEEWIQ